MKFIKIIAKMMIWTMVMMGIGGIMIPNGEIGIKYIEGINVAEAGEGSFEGSKMGMAEILDKLWPLSVSQKALDGKTVSDVLGISYREDHLPISDKRPGVKRKIKYIVVHNTANEGSTAQNERDYLSNPGNTASTSWNIVVDEDEIIEAIPVDEVAFHAGTQIGNQYGIGIEICESGNRKQTEANAVKLIAYLMKTYDISIENVKTHKDFSGKECPRQILRHWESFKNKVEEAYKRL